MGYSSTVVVPLASSSSCLYPSPAILCSFVHHHHQSSLLRQHNNMAPTMQARSQAATASSPPTTLDVSQPPPQKRGAFGNDQGAVPAVIFDEISVPQPKQSDGCIVCINCSTRYCGGSGKENGNHGLKNRAQKAASVKYPVDDGDKQIAAKDAANETLRQTQGCEVNEQ